VIAYAYLDGDHRFGELDPLLAVSAALVGFSPAGASGPTVGGVLAEGFQQVWPSSPCNEADVMFFALEAAQRTTVVLYEANAAQPLFSDPGCREQVSIWRGNCPPLATVRWVCRSGPGAPELCGRCELKLFPEGSPPEVCDLWRARCVESRSECELEWRVCRLGEPARVNACDLACACAKFETSCIAEGGAPEACAIKGEACVWWPAAGP